MNLKFQIFKLIFHIIIRSILYVLLLVILVKILNLELYNFEILFENYKNEMTFMFLVGFSLPLSEVIFYIYQIITKKGDTYKWL